MSKKKQTAKIEFRLWEFGQPIYKGSANNLDDIKKDLKRKFE